MFVPVSIKLGGAGNDQTLYDRSIELTTRQLAAFEAEARDMTEPLTNIAGDLRVNIEAAFASQGATGATGPWTALSPQYATWKASKGFNLPMLVGLRPTSWVGHRSNPPGLQRNMHQTYAVSGRMMKSLLTPVSDQITWHISPTAMSYTPTSDIAGFQEFGTEKMPARPPVDLSITFLRSVDRAFVTWLAAVMDRNGF